MECYDRTIRSLATLNIRKFVTPDNVYKVYSVKHEKKVFKLQLNNGIPEGSYTSTKDQSLYGAGQSAGIGGTKWIFSSILVIEAVEEVAPGC